MEKPKYNKTFVIKKYIRDEMSRFKNFDNLTSFVDSLNLRESKMLLRLLSKWRKNPVYRQVTSKDKWYLDWISIDKIKVNLINNDINPLLDKNEFLLSKIAKDKEICNHSEFRIQREIKNETILAFKVENYFRVIDGNHRIIRMACDGYISFSLLYKKL